MFEITNHKLIENDGREVRFVPTPNKRGRLKKTKPQFVIVHFTASGTLEGTVKWFENPAADVSAHLVIGRDGTLVQMGRFNQRLWHAGRSSWNGLKNLNSYSVGIELVNWGGLKFVDGRWRSWTGAVVAEEQVYLDAKNHGWHRYSAQQIDACMQVCKTLVCHYDIPHEHVLGHSDIAPRRKVDPGPNFPWARLREHLLAPDPAPETVERRSGLDRRQSLDIGTATPDTYDAVVRAVQDGFERY